MNGLAICAGHGGLELGLRLALGDAYRCVCYVEREAYAAACLVARMEDSTLDKAPIADDLRTFDGRPWRGLVDLVSGGYPCQPESLAGKRLGADDHRWLWDDVARVVGEIRPRYVYFENVAAHLTGTFPTVLRDLWRLRYRVAAGIFSAEEVGAPHRRERLFILGELANSGRGVDHAEQHEFEPGGFGAPGTGKAGAGQLVHTDGSGRRAQGHPGEPPGGLDWRLPLFPPGPTDLDTWRQVLDIDPSVEPAICRVADGMAPEMDRLRGCGNGVVPLVAAKALIHLAGDLAAGRHIVIAEVAA